MAYIEKVINHACNEAKRQEILTNLGKDVSGKLFIRDIFDGAAGTSTGGILAAGLFFNSALDINNPDERVAYTATEVAQIYARYGDTLFSIGSLKSLCDHEPLRNLFSTFFKDVNMSVAFNGKYVEVYSYDSDKTQPVRLNTDQRYQVQFCLQATSAVPYLYPAIPLKEGEKTAQLVDGGLATNLPAYALLENQRLSYQRKSQNIFLECYAFGTGTKETTDRAPEGFQFVESLKKYFAGDINKLEIEALEACKKALEDQSMPLTFFAHVNPKIEEYMQLYSCGPNFVSDAIKNALTETQKAAFQDMLTHLGFNLPQHDAIDRLQNELIHEIEAIDLDLLSLPDDVQGACISRTTKMKTLLVEYLERKITKYKDYNFFLSTMYKKTSIGCEEFSQDDYNTFFDLLATNSANSLFGGILSELKVMRSVEFQTQLTNLTPFTQEEWNFMTQQNTYETLKSIEGYTVRVLKECKSAEGLEGPLTELPIEEAVLESTPSFIQVSQNQEELKKAADLDRLTAKFLGSYIDFLNEFNNKRISVLKPNLADAFLDIVLKDVVLENVDNFVASIPKLIDTKIKGMCIDQVATYKDGFKKVFLNVSARIFNYVSTDAKGVDRFTILLDALKSRYELKKGQGTTMPSPNASFQEVPQPEDERSAALASIYEEILM